MNQQLDQLVKSHFTIWLSKLCCPFPFCHLKTLKRTLLLFPLNAPVRLIRKEEHSRGKIIDKNGALICSTVNTVKAMKALNIRTAEGNKETE